MVAISPLNRRVLLGGMALAAAAAGSSEALARPGPQQALQPSPEDASALLCAGRRDRYFALADSTGVQIWDDANEKRCARLHDIGWAYQDRLLAMPCTSPTIARLQLETVARWIETGFYPGGAEVVRGVMAYMGRV